MIFFQTNFIKSKKKNIFDQRFLISFSFYNLLKFMLPYNKICIIKGGFCPYGENVPRVGCCVACNCPYQYHCRGEYFIAMLILQCLLINWYIYIHE